MGFFSACCLEVEFMCDVSNESMILRVVRVIGYVCMTGVAGSGVWTSKGKGFGGWIAVLVLHPSCISTYPIHDKEGVKELHDYILALQQKKRIVGLAHTSKSSPNPRRHLAINLPQEKHSTTAGFGLSDIRNHFYMVRKTIYHLALLNRFPARVAFY